MNPTDESSDSWFLDNGATNHMANNSQLLTAKTDYKGKAKVLEANGTCLPILHVGYNTLDTFDSSHLLIMKDTLHVPHLTMNLLSISHFTNDNNVILNFDSLCCLVKDKTTRPVLL